MILVVDWGNVPSWLAAVGTVGALLVALGLLWRELSDRRSVADAIDQKPASDIFVWVEPRPDAGGWQTWVTNRSDEPVYDAVVYFTPLTDPPMPTVESVWGTIPPGGAKAGDRYGDHPTDDFGIPPVEIEFSDGRGTALAPWRFRRTARNLAAIPVLLTRIFSGVRVPRRQGCCSWISVPTGIPGLSNAMV